MMSHIRRRASHNNRVVYLFHLHWVSALPKAKQQAPPDCISLNRWWGFWQSTQTVIVKWLKRRPLLSISMCYYSITEAATGSQNVEGSRCLKSRSVLQVEPAANRNSPSKERERNQFQWKGVTMYLWCWSWTAWAGLDRWAVVCWAGAARRRRRESRPLEGRTARPACTPAAGSTERWPRGGCGV